MPYFIVEAVVDDYGLTARHWSAPRAFADSIDWRLVNRLDQVAISDGTKTYSIREVAEAIERQDFPETA